MKPQFDQSVIHSAPHPMPRRTPYWSVESDPWPAEILTTNATTQNTSGGTVRNPETFGLARARFVTMELDATLVTNLASGTYSVTTASTSAQSSSAVLVNDYSSADFAAFQSSALFYPLHRYPVDAPADVRQWKVGDPMPLAFKWQVPNLRGAIVRVPQTNLVQTPAWTNDSENLALTLLLVVIGIVPRHGAAIAKRLRQLHLEIQEENPESSGLATESLRGFWAFLTSRNDLTLPVISATSEGNVYATWRDSKRVLSIHFLSVAVARYVLFRPSSPGSSTILRSTGSAPAVLVMNIPETSAAIWALA